MLGGYVSSACTKANIDDALTPMDEELGTCTKNSADDEVFWYNV